MKAERRFNFSAIAAVELSKAGENTMGEDDPNSSQSSSIRDEDTASESGSDTEAETLLSSHSHEEATAQRDIEQTAGMLKEKVASGNFQFLVWTCINTLATIVIVGGESNLERILTTTRYSPTSKSSRTITYGATNPPLQPFTSLSRP